MIDQAVVVVTVGVAEVELPERIDKALDNCKLSADSYRDSERNCKFRSTKQAVFKLIPLPESGQKKFLCHLEFPPRRMLSNHFKAIVSIPAIRSLILLLHPPTIKLLIKPLIHHITAVVKQAIGVVAIGVMEVEFPKRLISVDNCKLSDVENGIANSAQQGSLMNILLRRDQIVK